MSDDELREWVADISSQDPGRIAAARKAAVRGSIADAYATYRLHVANSNIDGGYPQDPSDVIGSNGSVEACPGGGNPCSTFADFDQDGGKLDSFSVNGVNLSQRLAAGPTKSRTAMGLASVQFLVAYKAVSDDALVVAVKLRAGAQPISILDANYVARGGRQSQSENISGPPELQSGASATYTMAYPQAQPGGSATLRFYTDGAPVNATVDVPAPIG